MKVQNIMIQILFLYAIIMILSTKANAKDEILIGTRQVSPTDIKKGEIFASPTANSQNKACTKDKPCSLENAIIMLNNNKSHKNVLFLRGGTYDLNKIIQNKVFINSDSASAKLSKCKKYCQSCPKSYLNDKSLKITRSGSKDNPIIIESYPNEWAILDGGNSSPTDVKNRISMVSVGLELNRDIQAMNNISYVKIRRLEIKGVRTYGIRIRGDHNTVEGCKIHHNFLEGISISPKNIKELKKQTSYNTIMDNKLFNNSDNSLTCKDGPHDYEEGEEADGVSISGGEYNIISHNEVYGNSDDGIDTFNGNYTKVEYNLIHHNGLGAKGNGNGLKAGGCSSIREKEGKCKHSEVGLETISSHNISYANRKSGFSSNSGTNPVFKFNTAYDNGKYGFHTGSESILESNIAYGNKLPPKEVIPSKHKNNSWQKKKIKE